MENGDAEEQRNIPQEQVPEPLVSASESQNPTSPKGISEDIEKIETKEDDNTPQNENENENENEIKGSDTENTEKEVIPTEENKEQTNEVEFSLDKPDSGEDVEKQKKKKKEKKEKKEKKSKKEKKEKKEKKHKKEKKEKRKSRKRSADVVHQFISAINCYRRSTRM